MRTAIVVGLIFGCLFSGASLNAQSTVTDWLCEGAEVHEEAWFYQTWFGWFHEEGQGWIYHDEHGMQYAFGQSVDSFYLFDMAIGNWIWTSCTAYPYIYKYGRNPGWYWYYRGCSPGDRWFMGMEDQGAMIEQAINIPVKYILLPTGSFTMGSPTNERGRATTPNETQHSVTLTRQFYISPTEITFQQYRATWEHATSRGFTDLSPGYHNEELDPHGLRPVEVVSWFDAIKWLNLRSEVTGLTPVYYTSPGFGPGNVVRTGMPTVYANWNANGYRLPTEAEWEYACRAGTTTAFYTGGITYTASSPIDPNLGPAGWYGGNSSGGTKTVAEKIPNAWGIYDMHGNVYEWCWDWENPYTSSSATNPKGPSSGEMRIIRGGGFWSGAGLCRSAARYSLYPDLYGLQLGFRAVVTAGP